MNRNEVHAKCKEENIYYINNPKFFDKLEKITSRYPNQIGHVLHSKKNADLEQWVISMTKNFIDFEKCNLVTRSYWIIHGITKLPKCERDECVCSVGMNSNVNFKQGYAPFCTTSCALKAYNATIKKEYRKNYINRKSPKRPVSSKLDEIDCTNLNTAFPVSFGILSTTSSSIFGSLSLNTNEFMQSYTICRSSSVAAYRLF